MSTANKTSLGAVALLAASSFLGANALPSSRRLGATRPSCPDVRGTFTIEQLALYPENADFDFDNCLLYIGALFNASVSIYNPKTHSTSTLSIPNVTHDPVFHVGGVAANPYTHQLSIVVDAGAAFNTGGRDISGTNLLLEYDPVTLTETYRLNLTETTNGTFGGFQDVEFDRRGNVYVVGTFPSSILRVERNGTVVNEWFKANVPYNVSGFGGLASKGDILLANDNPNHQIVRFDMTAAKGTPMPIPLTPPTALNGSDAIYLPPKYDGTVLLAAVDALGVDVLRSKDGRWETAEYLGQVSNAKLAAQGASVTAPVQIGQSLYMVEEFFADPVLNRTSFPFVDITNEVERLLC